MTKVPWGAASPAPQGPPSTTLAPIRPCSAQCIPPWQVSSGPCPPAKPAFLPAPPRLPAPVPNSGRRRSLPELPRKNRNRRVPSQCGPSVFGGGGQATGESGLAVLSGGRTLPGLPPVAPTPKGPNRTAFAADVTSHKLPACFAMWLQVCSGHRFNCLFSHPFLPNCHIYAQA